MAMLYARNSADQLGELIRRRREAAGLTQRQLAGTAGVSLGTLRDLEQGRTGQPRQGTVEDLAVALGLDRRDREQLIHARRPDVQHARSPGLRIRVLGPLAVWRDGAAVGLGPPRQRAVLGLLALHGGDVVHRDEIIDVLWRNAPPASAVTQVQGYISRLRRLLRPPAETAGGARPESEWPLPRLGVTYRLLADAAWLDLAVFEDLIGRASKWVAVREPLRACELYEQALGLWDGDALADIDAVRGYPLLTETTCRRTETVVGYGDAAILAGVPGGALPHLRTCAAREALNEQVHARLMIALASTGQQAAALRIFEQMRRRLDDELGIRPGPELAEAYRQVLHQIRGISLGANASPAGQALDVSQVLPRRRPRRARWIPRPDIR